MTTGALVTGGPYAALRRGPWAWRVFACMFGTPLLVLQVHTRRVRLPPAAPESEEMMSEEREPAFNPDAGEHVEFAACRLLAMARERNAEVFCLFNDTRMTARPGMLLEEVLDGWSEGRRRTNETTPDAVEQAIASLVNVLVNECSHTSETASALDVCLANLRHARHAERARHAEEVARLEAQITEDAEEVAHDLATERNRLRQITDQLRRLRKSEKTAREYINMRLRDEAQAENVQFKAERDSLRSLLPDVRACAEYLVEPVSCLPSGLRQSARNILAALDSQGGEGE